MSLSPQHPAAVCRDTSRVWNVILAAGDGRRLADLTHQLHGDGRPKQFAVLKGDRSLLQDTLARMAVVAPPSRTVVVVGDAHLALARRQLADYPQVDLVAQPRNLGTAPGVLLPLARVLAVDPDATVVVTPSDHHYSRPARFTGKLPYVVAAAAAAPSGLCLVGASAHYPSSDLGWIVPGDPLPTRPGANQVDRFVEKPSPLVADRLLRAGALWNTFVIVGRAEKLWERALEALPGLRAPFERYLATLTVAPGIFGGVGTAAAATHERAVLELIYDQLQAADFCRDVLPRVHGLGVVSVGDCGWSDWGTPERLFASLAGTDELDRLAGRLGDGLTVVPTAHESAA